MDPARDLRGRQIIAGGLMGGIVVFLALASFVHFSGRPEGPEIVSYAAIAWALVSPMLAGLVRDRVLAKPPAPGVSPQRAALIAFFAILEAPAFLCAAALIIARSWWPLAAAAVPVGAMALNFPRVSETNASGPGA